MPPPEDASFVTVALTVAVPLVVTLAGGCWVIAINSGAVIVIAAVAGLATREVSRL
jgi:hypothetical protein